MQLTDKRVLLVGGKGGVGKTTVSSALGLLAAERGKRCLIVSTDPAHSLADAFDRPIGDVITRLAPHLYGLELDPDHEVEAHLKRVLAQLKKFTRPQMYGEVERQIRLTRQSPGAQEAALLERMARVIDEGVDNYDLIIFDTAPTGHTLRLLSLPEAMAAWSQGLLRSNQKSEQLGGVLKHLTPNAGRDIDNPLNDPKQAATSELEGRTQEIAETLLNRQRLLQRTRERLQDAAQSALVFVLTPEKLPILETGRAVEALQAEKLPLAGLVVNRILPDSADGEFLAQRRALEKTHLAEIDQRFKAQPRFRLALQPTDIQGLDGLGAMAQRLAAAGI